MRTQTLLVVAAIGVMVVVPVDPPERTALAQGVAPPSLSERQDPSQDSAIVRAAFDRYCVTCHNQRTKTGGLALDVLDVTRAPADAETWEKVIQRLRLRNMPPMGAPRPDDPTYEMVAATLETRLDRAAAARPDPGRPVLHRLNRTEYANAIHDILGLEVDVTSLLPPDDSAFGFDNVADVLGSSPTLLQSYLTAARRISALAVGDPRGGPAARTYSVRQDLSQDQHLEGMPLGTLGGVLAKHVFPVDGEYDIQVRLYRTNLNAIHGLEEPHELELTIDGERKLLATIGGADDLMAIQANQTDASDAIEARRLRIRLPIAAGERTLRAVFLGAAPVVLRTNRLKRFERDFDNPFDAEGAPHVQSITIVGPFNATGASVAPAPRLFTCKPSRAADEPACAGRILATLARRAYRRAPTARELDELRQLYDQGRANGSFETGIQFALRGVLASPAFVFRTERESTSVAAGVPYRITDEELASRLSFFLWSTIPDEALLKAAERGALRRQGGLAEQVRRMLADPRAEALVTNFAGQWLQLRNLRGIVPNPEQFPDFDDNLRQAFQRETELFVASVIRDDRSAIDLLTGDYTFVNERLARHYGMPGVFGSRFRRVPVSDDARRGLLGKGAVLLVTSHANNTSPVLRGKWVLDNLLGAPPPPPPPNVPALEESAAGTTPRTMREQMERHRSNPTCAACHKVMDPIGFALENFDVVGAWRTTTDAGVPLDTTDTLADGTVVRGATSLRQALVKRSDVFAQTLTRKLMVYALGRGLTSADMPAVRAIVRDAARQDYRMSAIVLGIVNSVPFQMRIRAAVPPQTAVARHPSPVARGLSPDVRRP
jgi:mono/diheme cytochrome c family protein